MIQSLSWISLPFSLYSRQLPSLYRPSWVRDLLSGAFDAEAEAAADAGVPAALAVGLLGVLGVFAPIDIHEYFFLPPPRNFIVVLLTLSAEASCF